ncbi:OmpA family protein [Microscilla marina]|nr:OmpA family protein [Microscilla marina]
MKTFNSIHLILQKNWLILLFCCCTPGLLNAQTDVKPKNNTTTVQGDTTKPAKDMTFYAKRIQGLVQKFETKAELGAFFIQIVQSLSKQEANNFFKRFERSGELAKRLFPKNSSEIASGSIGDKKDPNLKTYGKTIKKTLRKASEKIEMGVFFLQLMQASYKKDAKGFLKKIYKNNPSLMSLNELFLAEINHYNNNLDTAMHYYQKAFRKFTKIKEDSIRIIENKMAVKDLKDIVRSKMQECYNAIQHTQNAYSRPINNLGRAINSEYDEYAPIISADESTLIFTSRRPNTTGGKRDSNDSLFHEDIYISYKSKGYWSAPEKIKDFNTSTHESGVALSPDGKQLFTYRDNRGGNLYVSDLKADYTWSKPRSLGKHINTIYHEPSVTISADGKTLFFSSDRPGGQGGLDIYKSEKGASGKWGKAVNLGPNINTEQDEDSPFIHIDGKTLFFSSRGHRGDSSRYDYDIYQTSLENDEWAKPKNMGYPINTIRDDIHFVLSGDYRRGYYSSIKGEGSNKHDIYVISLPKYNINKVNEIGFQVAVKILPIKFLPSSKTERSIVMLRGAVTDEVSKKLIDAKMKLIDVETNKVVDEFNSVNPSGAYSTTMESGKKYLLYVQKTGYMFYSTYFDIPANSKSSEKILNIKLKKLATTTPSDFRIYFKFGSRKIEKYCHPSLDKLVNFLETNPKVKVELAGYSDELGSKKGNVGLSEDRAKAVVDYLIEKGIDFSRLTYKGYGKVSPKHPNKTKHGRILNRRVECKVVGY